MKKFAFIWGAAAAWSLGAALMAAAQQALPVSPGAGVQPAAPATARTAPILQPNGAATKSAAQTGTQTNGPGEPFPAPNLKNFSATSPTTEEVNAFLKALWGYEPNRIWRVMAIEKTQAPGVSKVVVAVADKTQPGKSASTVFFTTPDGQHAIAENVIAFGAKPFAANRGVLQAQADGPARGASGKELLLVEFADLQCSHCKEAQATMDHLAQDFPQARVVFENFPLQEIHPFAMRAAEEGECVRRSKGDAAFFTYAEAVYATQDGLTPAGAAATLSAAVSRAGADPNAVATCAATPAVREAIAAQVKLGTSLGVDQTPMLAINGHLMPLGSLPYEVLKRMIAFQAGQDGLTVQVQPTLTTLK